ncbi:15426_t:CDS:1, partial [Dentiscutata erythropus]
NEYRITKVLKKNSEKLICYSSGKPEHQNNFVTVSKAALFIFQ